MGPNTYWKCWKWYIVNIDLGSKWDQTPTGSVASEASTRKGDVTPREVRERRLQDDIDRRNGAISDEMLNSMFPAKGYFEFLIIQIYYYGSSAELRAFNDSFQKTRCNPPSSESRFHHAVTYSKYSFHSWCCRIGVL